jgi:predicted Zn-dependent protease
MRTFSFIILFLILSSKMVFPFGEKPDFSNAQKKVSDNNLVFKPESVSENKKVKALTEDEIYDLEHSYRNSIKAKQFDAALNTLLSLPDSEFTKQMKAQKVFLEIFETVKRNEKESASDFSKETDLDEHLQKNINRLYKEAQFALVNDQKNLAQDILIQILYLHRRNFRAKELLELGLDKKVGMYKIQNMEQKYWEKSDILFYGGNYIQAIAALKTLSFFDRENPVVYKRLGSAYYMTDQKKKAVGAWNTALFYNPQDSELKDVITKTEKLIKDDSIRAKARKKSKKKKLTKITKNVQTRLLGIFATQEKAFTYAAQLKNQGLKPLVDEQIDGKWAVKVPIKKQPKMKGKENEK